jgi:hypothetical protein
LRKEGAMNNFWERVQRTKLWALVAGVGSGNTAIFTGIGMDAESDSVRIAVIVIGGLIDVASILGYIKVQGDVDKIRGQLGGK